MWTETFSKRLAWKIISNGWSWRYGGCSTFGSNHGWSYFFRVDIDPTRIEKRIKTRYIDRITHSYDEAMDWVLKAKANKENISVGLVGDIGEVLEQLIKDNITPDILTDQTSAHDPLNGYVPAGMSFEEALALRKNDPKKYEQCTIESMATHVRHMLTLKDRGAITFDYGNNLRAYAEQGGVENAFDFPGFVPAYIRPLFCEGKGRLDGQLFLAIQKIYIQQIE